MVFLLSLFLAVSYIPHSCFLFLQLLFTLVSLQTHTRCKIQNIFFLARMFKNLLFFMLFRACVFFITFISAYIFFVRYICIWAGRFCIYFHTYSAQRNCMVLKWGYVNVSKHLLSYTHTHIIRNSYRICVRRFLFDEFPTLRFL